FGHGPCGSLAMRLHRPRSQRARIPWDAMDRPSLSSRAVASSFASRPPPALPRRWRCAGVLLVAATVSRSGDEFEAGMGAGGAAPTSSSSTSTTSAGEGGSNPGATTTASSASSGEGGSAVSTGEGGGGAGGGNEGGGGSGPVGDCDPELSGEVPIPASCGVF